jgi:hypothetical protein
VILLSLCKSLLLQLLAVGFLKVRTMDDMFAGWECAECGGACEEGSAYCDDCAWVSEMGDDYDGEPDEAQEWYDFDPDC